APSLEAAVADGVRSWSGGGGVGVDPARSADRELSKGGPVARALTRPLVRHLERAKLYALPHYGVFRARDGRWLTLGIVDEGHFWRALCEELGLAPLGGLPMPVRIAAGPALRPVIAPRLRRRDRDEWLARCGKGGAPASPVLTPEEAARDPQVRARGRAGERGWIGSPLPGAIAPRGAAPKKGEHTEAILREL